MDACSVTGCASPREARGWCRRHYHRWYERGGDPASSRSNHHLSTAWRFWMKVSFTESCWLWTAQTDRAGYGRFHLGETTVQAHRWAYEFCVGSIPDGLQIDHFCRVHNCVLPEHLEPVTAKENVQRGLLCALRPAAS